MGWRKAAKGRTVWRIVEEVISQNLEKNAASLGFDFVEPAASEVGVFDFSYRFSDGHKSFVNIKSAVSGAKNSKDDISKGERLVAHFNENPDSDLFIASFILSFTDNPPSVKIDECVVMPVTWIPDLYVNPSNNGNLQSAHAKHLDQATKRTREEFRSALSDEIEVARMKRNSSGND